MSQTVIVKPEKTRTHVVHKFTSKELHTLREELVVALDEVDTLTAERKAVMGEIKGHIDRAKSEVSRIKSACSRGEEDQQVDVMLIRNFESGEREYWTYKEDSTVNEFGGLGTLLKKVKAEPLTPSDRQLEMQLIERENRRREDEAADLDGEDEDGAEA